MAIDYYDEAVTQKIKGWLADSSKMRVFSPDDTNRFIQTLAEDSGDKPVKLPVIMLSRNKDIEIESTIKQNKSFDGLVIKTDTQRNTSVHMNVIPIKTTYQLDIYTKKRIEADEYVRQYLFKLINNPQIIINIPYNNYIIKHTANLRVLNTISDTSDISTHLFPGQFYKWTIQLELQDGFLFSLPNKKNWTFGGAELDEAEKIEDPAEDSELPPENSDSVVGNDGDNTQINNSTIVKPDASDWEDFYVEIP